MPELMYYFSEISPEKPTTPIPKTPPIINATGPGILHSQFAPQVFRDHPLISGKPIRTLATLETLDR